MNEDAECSQYRQSQPFGRVPRLPFIQQNDPHVPFEAQGNGLGFAEIKRYLQRVNDPPIRDLKALDPARSRDVFGGWTALTRHDDLIPDSIRDVNSVREKIRQQSQFANR